MLVRAEVFRKQFATFMIRFTSQCTSHYWWWLCSVNEFTIPRYVILMASHVTIQFMVNVINAPKMQAWAPESSSRKSYESTWWNWSWEAAFLQVPPKSTGQTNSTTYRYQFRHSHYHCSCLGANSDMATTIALASTDTTATSYMVKCHILPPVVSSCIAIW